LPVLLPQQASTVTFTECEDLRDGARLETERPPDLRYTKWGDFSLWKFY
jgi:hypothetical protein